MLAALLLIKLTLAAPSVPEVCAPPETRDVKPLATFAQRSGALSVGLDSVATWCFTAEGVWSGGAKKEGKTSAEPIGECLKAITSCEKARLEVTEPLRSLVFDSLADLTRPYLGARYTPKRSGLTDRPSEGADCRSRVRSELFTAAQARMDLARLASQTQSEYANYKTWLFSEGLKCADAVARGVKDPTRKGIAIDAPVSGDGGLQRVPEATAVVAIDPGAARAARAAPTEPLDAGQLKPVDPAVRAARAAVTEGPDAGQLKPLDPVAVAVKPRDAVARLERPPEARASAPAEASEGAARERALNSSMLEKWRYLASQQSSLETDPDWQSGFLASRELRSCSCARPSPGEVVRRLEAKDRVSSLEADDAKNTTCALCLLDAYPSWKSRVKKQCALMDQLSDFELGVLERSDDGNGLPPRCFELVRAKRPAVDAGAMAAVLAPPSGGGGFIVTKTPTAAPAPMLPPSRSAEALPKATDYAPIPEREEGRMYVRVFMSSACVAEIEPGPMVARTGDLMPVPINAQVLSVRSPCGGMAEVYWGREEKPRVSETFGRNQPLQLQFAR